MSMTGVPSTTSMGPTCRRVASIARSWPMTCCTKTFRPLFSQSERYLRQNMLGMEAHVIFKQFYLACLAHASYLIGDEVTGTGVVVDPQRDIDQYIAFAAERALTIKHVFLTHLHADFVAGHLELRDRAGATIYLGATAKAGYAFTPLANGETLEFGRVRLKVLETPGHTPESISIVVYDLNVSDAVLNSQERPTLDQALAREMNPLTLNAVLELQTQGAQILDTRDPAEFAAAHLAGSINIGLAGQFATWAGTVLDRKHPIVLITE